MAEPRARSKAELPLSIAPRTLFVTGKGGVGKTTVAAALASAYRDAGVRTLLVQIAGQASPAALISSRPVGYEPSLVTPGLWSICIDPDEAMKEYARMRLKVRAVADRLVGNPVFSQFAQAAPGFRELLVLGKLWSLSEETNGRGKPRFEAIVVDAPATGHGLGLLGMAGVIARAFPVGPIASEAKQVDAFVKDPDRTGVVLVALAEEMPVNEAIEMRGRLDEQDVTVQAVVLNALLPERLRPEEVARVERALDGAPAAARSALETALYDHARQREQAEEHARLVAAVGELSTLPFLYTHELTREHVQSLSRWLTPSGQRALCEAARTHTEAVEPGSNGGDAPARARLRRKTRS